ncbi:MAG: YtxH domain-containing protein [Armatimonadetes bacterium]|nr:YtxH domain-containing protein [Armatimonadota bacterium]
MGTNDNDQSALVSILAGIGIGVLVGAMAGLLLAPKAGSESREDISKAVSDLTDKISQLGQQVSTRLKQAVDTGKQAVANKLQETTAAASSTDENSA